MKKTQELNDSELDKAAAGGDPATPSPVCPRCYMDDDRAISFAVSLLRPERLTDQLCFRTERSLANLIPVEVVRYDV